MSEEAFDTSLLRSVSIIDSNLETEIQQPQPFFELLSRSNIILLGDPGSGKTHLFEAAARHENAHYFEAGQFDIYASPLNGNETVFIDGLDETRSSAGSEDSLKTILRKVLEIKPGKLRLSCRVLDWLGDSDLSLLRPYFRDNGGYVVLHVGEPSEEEQFRMLVAQGIGDPSKFKFEANGLGLSHLMKNPQTLIMMAKLVQAKGWPNSKFDLYEQTTELLLLEHNRTHSDKNQSTATISELKGAAGAIFCTQLISNKSRVLKSDAVGPDDQFPVDRAPVSNHMVARDVLARRVFKSDGSDTYTYSHRTVAEFLSAVWLSSQCQQGLPVSRVLALLGVEGEPMPELRGLHAWLPNLLHEHSHIFISNDPIGILSYGDVRSFTLQQKKLLISQLEKLAERDPWFRHNSDDHRQALGELSDPELAPDFKEIIFDENANFHLRITLLEVLEQGRPIPVLLEEISMLLIDNNATYRERQCAFSILNSWFGDDKANLVNLVRKNIFCDSADARLGAEIISSMYPDEFGVEDIATVIDHYGVEDEDHAVGELWTLEKTIPDQNVDAVLAATVEKIENWDSSPNFRTSSEVRHFFGKLIVRYINSSDDTKPDELWRYLKVIDSLNDGYGSGEASTVRELLITRQHLVVQIFDCAWSDFDGDSVWLFWHKFQKAILHGYQTEWFFGSLGERVLDQGLNIDLRLKAYELAFALMFGSQQPDQDFFRQLYAFGELGSEFFAVRENACSSDTTDWRHENAVEKITKDQKEFDQNRKTQSDFDENVEAIKNGNHLGWLGYLAKVYFAMFSDVDNESPPMQRLEKWLGAGRSQIAIDALNNFVGEKCIPPKPSEVAELYHKQRIFNWWYAIQAGVDIRWGETATLDQFDDELLKGSLAIELYHFIWEREGNTNRHLHHNWIEELFVSRKELVLDVLMECAKHDLSIGRDSSDAIHRLTTHKTLVSDKSSVSFKLLHSHTNPAPYLLRTLVQAVMASDEFYADLGAIAEEIVSGSLIRGENRNIWYSVLFLCQPNKAIPKITTRSKRTKSPEILWAIRSIVSSYRSEKTSGISALSNEQISFLVRGFSGHFSSTPHPTSSTGDQNPWDASEFIRKLIDELSSRTDVSSTQTLTNLMQVKDCSSYLESIKHGWSNQVSRRRQFEYRQPSLNATIEVLGNKAPANNADLLALAIDQIRSLEIDMRNSNTDKFKFFWNEDQYGRITKPKSEESARDVLLDQLRTNLAPLYVRAEPEGHMAQDKRADIVLLPPPGMKLPIEIKRHYHSKLWSACAEQLQWFYARDPEADEYGIYLVFWYGTQTSRKLPKPPKGIAIPHTAQELEFALRSLVSDDKSNKIVPIVVDVTNPLDSTGTYRDS